MDTAVRGQNVSDQIFGWDAGLDQWAGAGAAPSQARQAYSGRKVTITLNWRRSRPGGGPSDATALMHLGMLDGPNKGASFETWIETQLVPMLKPGDIVILDDLSSHKSARAKKLVKAAGAHLLFLPPCSPGLNPIEHRASLRKTKNLTPKASFGKPRDGFPIPSLPKRVRTISKNSGYASVQAGQTLAVLIHPPARFGRRV